MTSPQVVAQIEDLERALSSNEDRQLPAGFEIGDDLAEHLGNSAEHTLNNEVPLLDAEGRGTARDYFLYGVNLYAAAAYALAVDRETRLSAAAEPARSDLIPDTQFSNIKSDAIEALAKDITLLEAQTRYQSADAARARLQYFAEATIALARERKAWLANRSKSVPPPSTDAPSFYVGLRLKSQGSTPDH